MSDIALEPTYTAGRPASRPQQCGENTPSRTAFVARLYVSTSKYLSDGDAGGATSGHVATRGAASLRSGPARARHVDGDTQDLTVPVGVRHQPGRARPDRGDHVESR